MKRSSLQDQRCPVARAAARLVDAWTFVILRELFLGNRRFEALRLHTGMSPRSLSLRLAQLVASGVLEKRAREDDPAIVEYRLTPQGLELWPVMVLLRQWGERWSGPWGRDGPPLRLNHRGRGHALKAVLACAECGEPVDARCGEVLPTPRAQRDRDGFAQASAQPTPRRRSASGEAS